MTSAGHHTMLARASAPYTIAASMRGEYDTNKIFDSGTGFHIRGLGTMPMGVTITAWFRYAAYSNVALSKSVLKYGDRNNGVGFGTWYSSNQYFMRAGLVEGKYWACFGSPLSITPKDFAWHHVALRVKSGTSPLFGACYIDGVEQTPYTGSGTAAMNSPSGIFSVCGRDNGQGWETPRADVRSTRVCIFGAQLSAGEIMADYLAGEKMPTNTTLTHYWDATVENSEVLDKVGSWNLSFSQGCSISNDTPWA